MRCSQDASDVVADRCFGPHIFARFLGAISVAKTPALRWVVSSRKIPEALLEAHNAGRRVRCEDVDCARMGAGPAEGGERVADGDVAAVELHNTLDVPTTFAISCRLFLYRIGHSAAAAPGGA